MWRFTRDRRVLEELVQDVLVEVYLSLSSFRGNALFPYWGAKDSDAGWISILGNWRIVPVSKARNTRATMGASDASLHVPSEAGEALSTCWKRLCAKGSFGSNA